MSYRYEDVEVVEVTDLHYLIQFSGVPGPRKKANRTPRSAQDLMAGDSASVVLNDSGTIIAVVHPGHRLVESPPAVRTRSSEIPDTKGSKLFLNPYVMLATRPRTQLRAASPWADATGPGHARISEGTLSGSITVTLTALSPLLLWDQSSRDPSMALAIRHHDGEVLLDPTAIKGMLRSAFEAVTNSRMGVFHEHSERLSVRLGRGRVRFPVAPERLLASELRPARTPSELSPADRLFGWVSAGRQDKRGASAYRGHLAIVDVKPIAVSTALASSPKGIRLTTLNGPKPAQYRFYLKQADGSPLPAGQARDPNLGYATTAKGGRAIPRKFYWPQGGWPGGYWNLDGAEKFGGVHREWLGSRAKESVARRISEWVRPRSAFEFQMRFENVEAFHLGILLALLRRPQTLQFSVGGGKPLGFGTVTLHADLDRSEISTSNQRVQSFFAWNRSCQPSREAAEASHRHRKAGGRRLASSLTKAEMDSLEEAGLRELEADYPGLWAQFASVSAPPDLTIHYPREGVKPVPETYKWFKANENGGKRPLPDVKNPGLPYQP